MRTQLRTRTYDSQTLRLLSKTSPEAGTVAYTYNADNTLATVTDAKNQRKVFTYDTYGRITQIARGTVSGSVFTEDTSQRTTYTYEGTNSGYSSATNGRVSQVTYQGPHGLSFVEMYSYVNAGGVSKKRVQITGTPFGSSTINMDAGYTYDGEGRVLSTTYPGSQYNSNGTVSGGANYNYSYDTLGRLQAMSDSVSNTTWVSGVTYGPADEMLSMTANGFTETRTYNANLQLTDLISGANVHLKYNYSASQNNGQILSQDDLVSGETIGYQYDSLKRLTQANATGDPSGSWQQNFGYDGFGNLTNKTSTNAPQLSVAVDWATNRIQSFAGYDNNGNMTGYAGDIYSYDLQNRMIQASVSGGGTVRYGYDTTNHRVYKGGYNGGTTTYSAEEFYFYGAEGHKYGTWQINPSSGVLLQASVTKQWFGGRLVSPEDRLGSKGRYFAFGEKRTSVSPANPPNDQEKFATYTRDAATGLDYANQRYFSSIVGRFTRPDPYGGSANPVNPQSWNRYSYVANDPTNSLDTDGLCGAFLAGIDENSSNNPYINGFTSETSMNAAFPYSKLGIYGGLVDIVAQSLGAQTTATNVAIAAIEDAAAQDTGPIDITTFSGGAAAFASAYPQLSQSVRDRIRNVTYISPGPGGTTLPSGTSTVAIQGSLFSIDYLIGANIPTDATYIFNSCGHDAGCQLMANRALLLSRTSPCPTPGIFLAANEVFNEGFALIKTEPPNILFDLIADGVNGGTVDASGKEQVTSTIYC